MVSIDALAPHKENEDKFKVASSVEEIAEDIKKDLPPEEPEESEEPKEPEEPEEPEESEEPERE